MKNKEFLYVGFYFDKDNNFILKVGTTKDLDRRRKEHNARYRKATANTMPEENEFHYLWTKPLSKYNTFRYEDKTIEKWKAEMIGEYIRNDRFRCNTIPEFVEVTIRKKYLIPIKI